MIILTLEDLINYEFFIFGSVVVIYVDWLISEENTSIFTNG